MGVYTRPDSPYYWLALERQDLPPLREATKIRRDATTAQLRKDNRELAHIRYHQRMAELARAHQDLPSSKPVITFDAYADWYEIHKTAKKRGATRELEILKTLRARFGNEKLHHITAAGVEEWRTTRATKVSTATVNRELDVLKHVLATAVPMYLTASPIKGLRRLRMQPARTHTLSPAEEARILKTLTTENRAIVILALDTLMRVSDIERLTRADDRGSYLVVGNSKTGYYEVPLSTRARKALDALPAGGTHFFRRRTGSIAQMFERACKRVKVPYGRGRGVTVHALRHTGASRMVERGADLRTVMEIGGWRSLRQLARYTHPTDAVTRAAVELVARPVHATRKRPRKHKRR